MHHMMILAVTVNGPHWHWPGWLTGFGGGLSVGLLIGLYFSHSKRI